MSEFWKPSKWRGWKKSTKAFLSLFFIAIGLLGLLWGSFLNVVIHRLPKTAAAGISNSRRSLLYLAWPWSFCPQCEEPIKPWNNIPLLSYLLLRGKSSCCGCRISLSYPLVEIVGAVIVFAAVLRFGLNIDVFFVVLFLSFLLVASIIDLKRYYLLDILTLPLLWLGLLANLDARFVLINEAVLGAVAGYLSLALLSAAVSPIINRRAMGEGDFKLLAALGAWLGWQMLPFVLFTASIIALFFSAVKSFVRGRGGRQIPFGPCLSVAAIIMLFYGNEIILYYWDFVWG